MEDSEKPKVGLAGIIIRDEKVLLGKRIGSHGEGTWSFPGGHLEHFEEFEDCFYREIQEETGLTRSNVSLVDNFPNAITNDFFKKENRHYITLFFRGFHLWGEPVVMEPDKCERWDWFYWNKLPKPFFLPIENLLKYDYNPFFDLK